jgi:hypothetical protein
MRAPMLCLMASSENWIVGARFQSIEVVGGATAGT